MATIGPVVLVLFVFPDALPIFPALVLSIWIALFAGNQQYDARARRLLWFATIVGVLLLLAGIATFVLVS